MTQLDLETTTLAAAGTDVRGAALALHDVSSGVLVAAAAPAATGDAGLGAALQDLAAAWRAAHEALGDELGALAAVLARASEVFEGAERATTHDLAALLGGPRPGDGA
ncbi:MULTISPECIES: hypothetical protein [unclassified Isoptericola]|uniref:hypothetical protein n=1 Tax=unclassified Isoptericola TaxID=2623355 RepID=UPI0035E57CF5|nr:hypothetical protein [Isoptericola sp. QY 916]